MRAVQYERYGAPEVLRVVDVETPRPGPGQVLVRVKAASLNPKDSLVRKGKFRRFTGSSFPRGVGYDFSGVVEALGAGVSRWQVGQPVFGMVNGWAGGAVAEALVVGADELALKPTSLDFEQAAALPLAALTALQALRDEARVQPGMRVLIHGASGGVGVFAIQVARVLGAEVTTTSSARNRELCLSLGAHAALDYQVDSGLEPQRQWGAFFDVFGNRRFSQVKPALGPRATYVSTVPSFRLAAQHLLTRFSARRARLVRVRSNSADLQRLAEWADAGALRPVIDQIVPLSNVAQAQAHIETKRARGKVVVTFT